MLEQHIDHLLHNGIGVHIDGTRRRFARHRYGRLIRKGTERIGEGLEVGVLGGEHNDEEQADAAAHAKCLRVRQTCETRKCVAQSKRMDFLFYRLTDANALEFGHILASSCKQAGFRRSYTHWERHPPAPAAPTRTRPSRVRSSCAFLRPARCPAKGMPSTLQRIS